MMTPITARRFGTFELSTTDWGRHDQQVEAEYAVTHLGSAGDRWTPGEGPGCAIQRATVNGRAVPAHKLGSFADKIDAKAKVAAALNDALCAWQESYYGRLAAMWEDGE